MTLLEVLRDMGAGVTVHGFRSAFRDWVDEQTDYLGEVAEIALAHTISNKGDAAYRRTVFLEKRRSVVAVGSILLEVDRGRRVRCAS